MQPVKKRCAWCTADPLYQKYHDEEWGVPLYDSQSLFQFLILESMQAGLSWITILKKRENYYQLFNQLDPFICAHLSDKKIQTILKNPGIIRNRLKVNSIVHNARAFLAVEEKTGSFASYLWDFTEGQVIQNKWKTEKELPTKTIISDNMSKQLKKDGFIFVGSTICYAFMQAVGMVNDHVVNCFRHSKLMA